LETPKERKRIPVWMKVSSVAALLALLFTVATVYFLPKDYISNTISSSTQETEVNNDVQPAEEEITPIVVDKQLPEPQTTQTAEVIKDDDQIKSINLGAEEIQNDNFEKITEQKKSLLTDASNLPLIEEDDLVEETIEPIRGRLTFATIFAPIYLNSIGGGSGIDSEFKDNPMSGNSSYSYGVKVAYQLNSKFSLQSGVNLISLGYRTNNVYVTPGVAVLSLSNVRSNPLVGKSNLANNSKEGVMNVIDENKGTLDQVFGYVEIPVELKYSVTDGKLGVNVVGGFSTLLLNKDEIFIRTENLTQSLGASNNLRSVNFSGNIGLDVDYLINKNLFINVSPMLKVQTNTFSKNAGSFQPYYLGVYTGLNYKF
jgi:hypothetical protein